jgi:hypothetical protein
LGFRALFLRKRYYKCVLKVDLMKAYDSVSMRWDFVLAVLRTVGVPVVMVWWIEECITTPRFSICINSELRQGYHLSPYLFVLVMEAFSRVMDNMTKRAQFRFHWSFHREKISHLCFADYLLILCEGEFKTFVAMVKECFESV